MKAILEFPAFVGLAAVAHLIVWQAGADGARIGAGATGPDTVTLAGADATLDALVAQWDSPPVTAPVPVAAAAPHRWQTARRHARSPTARRRRRCRRPRRDPICRCPPPSCPKSICRKSICRCPRRRPQRWRRFAQRPPARPELRPEPQPEPRQATPAPPAQVARGEGRQDTAAADSAPTGSGEAAAAPDPGLMAQWGGAIRASIERRKRYPNGTRASGTVTLSLVVTTGGALAQVGLAGIRR